MNALTIGTPLPDIAMEAANGGMVKPSDFRGRKLVLFFYPKDNTPGCTSEAKDFSAHMADFDAVNCAVLGISKDSAKKHLNFIAKHELLVALATDAEEGGLSDTLGIWREKKLYGRSFMGMMRTTILVNENGEIAQVWDKVKVGGHAAAVLEAARAL